MPAVQSVQPTSAHVLLDCRYQSILCPGDFSSQSAVALNYAAALARRWNGELTVLYAVDPMMATAAPVAFGEGSYVERVGREHERQDERA